MALLHGYPLGLFDHPKWTSQVRDEGALLPPPDLGHIGERVKGSNLHPLVGGSKRDGLIAFYDFFSFIFFILCQ